MEQDNALRTFAGAAAIVTGGASGIGRALTEALARRGARVAIADRQIELAGEVVEGIRAGGGEATATEVDVTDFAAVDRVVEDTLERWGRLDYLFNNAGIGIGGEATFHQLEDWYQVLDVNLRGVVHGVHAAYPVMRQQGFGHIVNTASTAGLLPAPGSVGYAAAKHAVVGLSTSLRIEAEAAGIRVSVLCPGVIRTPILDGGKYGKLLEDIPEEALQRFWQRLRPMDPDRFAPRVLRAVAANRAIIVVPSWWRLFWWIHRLSPTLSLALAKMLYRALRREVERVRQTRESV